MTEDGIFVSEGYWAWWYRVFPTWQVVASGLLEFDADAQNWQFSVT